MRPPILVRLKRWLAPLRPVLRPLWRPIRRFVERPSKPPTGPAVLDVPSPGTIRPMVKAEFDRLAARYPYYRNRWTYTSVACDIAGDLISRHDLHTALELGPHIRSVVVGADVMDLRAQPDLEAEGRLLVHNATVVPWPADDASYDLFVALQVFEHLGDGQPAAFREVCRVARHAIISLPIDWEMDDPTNSHHMISNERVLAWFAPVVPTRIELGNPGPNKRLVYVFEDLPSAAGLEAGAGPDNSSDVNASVMNGEGAAGS